MPLSIKNPKAEQLARAVAELCGETLTEAIIRALEERLEKLEGRRTFPDLLTDILEISERCAALPDLDVRTADEIIGYDELGGLA